MAEKLIFPIGFDLEDGVKQVEKDWANVQKRDQDDRYRCRAGQGFGKNGV